MKVLAVIPARGGSKGIPRKNMRLMNGKPLISYAIENALASNHVDRVVVTSDSDEVLAFARQYEAVVPLFRDSVLARDAVTLDPVIYDAVTRVEEASGESWDVVVTLQPTSPLLTPQTLDAALDAFASSGKQSMLSVVNTPHLRWKESAGGVVPEYVERANRQQLPPSYAETGAFLIAKRECMTEASRLGEDVAVFKVPEWESRDIDSIEDWIVCESLLSRKTIVFRVDGSKELGLGHVYRALTLAYELIEHEVVFISRSACREGIDKLESANMKVVEIADDVALLEWLEAHRPDIYVHDCLDTSVEFVLAVKALVSRVVTFEDLGHGAGEADAVVNALYEGASPHQGVYTGRRYVCLRDEFMTATPKPFSERVARVLVMFGGTDPLNLSSRIYDMAVDYNRDRIRVEFDFILGSGYSGESVASIPECGIRVVQDVIRVTDYMQHADLALSSQGRTTFELASMGVPTLVLAQNRREQLHRFAQMDNGFINLGLGGEVSDQDIRSTFEWLMGAVSVRREMHRLMLGIDLKSGIKRVRRIILGEVA